MDFSQFRHRPWAHQAAELEDYWDRPARALLWQMRTGKTKVIIDSFGLWCEHKELHSAIIIAPNGVHRNWTRIELPKHAWFEYREHTWSSLRANTQKHQRQFESVLRSPQFGVFAFGKESILGPKVQVAIKRILRRGSCALIVDESHHFGKPGAKRTRLARGLAKKCRMRRILSGTATGNSPLRLFSQFEILKPGALGFNRFGDYEKHYAEIGEGYDPRSRRRYKRIDGYKNQEELQGRVAKWSSVVLREDCEDLPDVVMSKHYYEPSSLQLYAYEQLRKEYIAELESGSLVEAIDSGTRLLRLQQVLSNFAVTDTYEIERVDPSSDPRLDALVSLIDGPTIVWCRFREDLRQVATRLKSENISFGEYHGSIKNRDRDKVRNRFMGGELTVFLGQPSCAGEGLDLSAANTIIWFSHVFDVVTRDQATERATQMGGHSVSVIDIAVADSVDEYILSNLEQKRSVADNVTGRELRNILERCRI